MDVSKRVTRVQEKKEEEEEDEGWKDSRKGESEEKAEM